MDFKQILVKEFPVSPVPVDKDVIDTSVLHPGDLHGLLSKSWLEALNSEDFTDPNDLLLLSEEGLKFYLPYFLWRALFDEDGNYSYFVPVALNQRSDVLSKRALFNVQQRIIICAVLSELIGSDFDEEKHEQIDYMNERKIACINEILILLAE